MGIDIFVKLGGMCKLMQKYGATMSRYQLDEVADKTKSAFLSNYFCKQLSTGEIRRMHFAA